MSASARFRRAQVSIALRVCLFVTIAVRATSVAASEKEGVALTLHNLSVTGPGEVRSISETEICKFCHVPHSAVVPNALWGHRLSQATYTTPELRRGRPGARPAPQPDGSSRLCLSCHDGTVALGEVAGLARRGSQVVPERLGPGSRGFLGTDLSGSHPISFVLEDTAFDGEIEDSDIGLRPLASIRSQAIVRLDDENKMQCTTCHDPHSDSYYRAGRVPRFWVAPTLEEVCSGCHVAD